MLVKCQFDGCCFNGIGSTTKSPPKPKAALGVSVPANAGLVVSPHKDTRKKKYISDGFKGPHKSKATVLVQDPCRKWNKSDMVSPGIPYKRSVGRKLEDSAGNVVVDRMQTNCSRKWSCYKGCIPSMLQALETVSDLDKALEPWERTLTNKERSIILKEQASWERAVEIFDWLKRKGFYELNVIHYNIMFRILGRAQKWEHMERLWQEMEVSGIVPINSTFGTLIDAYSKGGLREEAMFWLEKMKEAKMEPDVVTTAIVMQMYKKSGELHKVEEFFRRWSMSSSNCRGIQKVGRMLGREEREKVSDYTYNTLIDMYGKAGQLKEASETVERMLKDGIVPTTVTFNTIIHMHGNHGKLEEVSVLMRMMEELKCPPDTRTYNILISLHAKHDDISMAQSYFRRMKETGLEPDLVSYRTLLYALSIRQLVGSAEELVLEMDEKGLEIDEYTQSALTRMYVEAKMLEKSWLWFRRFHLSGSMSSSCYSANIDAYGECGLVLEAEKVFTCCKEVKKLTVVVFNVMIKAYGFAKQYDKARHLFDGMGVHSVVPDKRSYISIIQILASDDRPDEATLYLRKMQRAGLVVDCFPYFVVISSFVKLGKLHKAEELYKEMIQFDVKPDVVLYGIMINAFADAGSVKQALAYVDAMKAAGQAENTAIYKTLIKLYTKVGYLKEAQDIYILLQSSEAGPDVYSSNCMIDLYSERSMVARAEEIFASLKRKGTANEFSFAMMLCMYKRLGRFEDAILLAKQMRRSGLLTDLLSYNNVLGLYASNGRLREAVVTFQELVAAGIPPDDVTFKSLGMVLLKCGVSKQAVSKLEAKTKSNPQRGLQAWNSVFLSLFDIDHM